MDAVSSEEVSFLDEAEGKNNFKTCSQIDFYRRQKRLSPGKSLYRALLDTLTLHEESVRLQIIHEATKVPLMVEISGIENNTLRIKINEVSPPKPRYEVPDVILQSPSTLRLTKVQEDSTCVVLVCDKGAHRIKITANPFQIDVLSMDEILLSINSLGLLYFEHLLLPLKNRNTAAGSREKDSLDSIKDCDEGLWEAQFGHAADVKANGPTSVGLDFALHGFEHVYGLPEHTETLQLQSTSDNDAYRLYNLDVFGHKLHEKMGIYGSVPLLMAHKSDRTIGVFWLNASETLVEITTKATVKHTLSNDAPEKPKQRVVPETDVRWMSESGVIDVFLLLGPSPFDVFEQYAQLTGTQALPPLFSLGYHQCRWNYVDEEDVKAVDAGFDEHDIPYDVIWLDIDHTNDKRYFTWDKVTFPHPRQMQDVLREKKRKLVVISDPHIKVDLKYSVYAEAKDKGYFVKDNKNKDFVGICWPGSSCYLDFTNPDVQKWYSSLFAFEAYKDSTDILFIWNDMNEPSVFKAPELTMPKSNIHHGGWEHRDVHNLYGFYQQMASAEGLIQRSGGKERPFVLTRSFFAGSQRYGAVWTGDNTAEWGYLKITIPMLLTISISGISFCGADVGGFIGDPEPELLVRWYQAGAYQPFFRGHATKDTKRREPWLFGEKNTRLIREAIRERYRLLPYFYLLFYRAHVSAEPVMRPLWVEFPKEIETFHVDDEFMLGHALLVHPVTAPAVSAVGVLLPGPEEVWYDFRSFRQFEGASARKIPVTLENIPVFQRGGTIIALKTAVGKSSEWMKNISYELLVALDCKGSAVGEIYIDDGHSFQYLHKNEFLHRRFIYNNSVLSSSSADEKGLYSTKCLLEKVQILGFSKCPSSVAVIESGKKKNEVAFVYDTKTSVLILEKLSLNVGTDWEICIK
ncbi:hypothetical protein NDU88_001385 [Pleurodeles waltl]|uniref:Neutral alpha-glucosidase C n=1 Tax=Pleurodeles waltl TaxID=8319 RepID=A0AAV7MNA5_PLEWA|nr:hypothetical protein NDU88_001385 [Pleurodeles waltl]